MTNVQPTTGRIPTLALTLLCQSTQAVSLAGLPLLLPLIRQDMELSFSQAGSLASASLLIYALMQIPAGYLADRRSPRLMVAAGALGMTSLSLLLAFCTRYWQLLVLQFFWGFSASLIFTPAMSVFVGWFPPSRRTTAMALPLLGPNMGIVAVTLIFPVIANHFASWRQPFMVAGSTGIVFALALLAFGKNTISKNPSAKFSREIIRELFRYKQVWICYLLQFIRFGTVQGILFWLPSLLINEKYFPLQLAGIMVALQALIMAPCNILGAYISDRYKIPTLIIAVSMIMLGTATALLVPLTSPGLIIAAVIINAIFIQMYFGPLFNLAIEKLGADKAGISNGVGNMFAILGGLATAYYMGILRDNTGSFEWGFYSISIMAGVGLVSTLYLELIRRRTTTDKRN